MKVVLNLIQLTEQTMLKTIHGEYGQYSTEKKEIIAHNNIFCITSEHN